MGSGDDFGVLFHLVRFALAICDGDPHGLGPTLLFARPPDDRIPRIARDVGGDPPGPDLGRRLAPNRDPVARADVRAGHGAGVVLIRTAGELWEATGVEMRHGHGAS